MIPFLYLNILAFGLLAIVVPEFAGIAVFVVAVCAYIWADSKFFNRP